ncbi:Predicted component of the ribosome quality control (RQC) complex, YloA/Tae2 family, contains fibronectin-binding (FbpA) and DUF814 domains [Peptoclostridium litorale DSM 5388]|uniref:Rqc2 homolog RqcH n=1 Tax=Peptoclostridium litorale DSM 5388 TaxID=1121324 RepID=A0A069RCQ3_PEPLI|nr:NFACT RNA binding domain-containing protein [Peptoclostridium litorale]KDR94020.1 fibronectin-binding protein A [Peptoclostridium litorale DSM 5388]SIN79706.1 Predicted component of the ribosome quality control (RQC) complex, YloA/Tae2 family, contains fibronectin-binding (FbpA) and DUF814 domains [Peptoclostridium litorale DSM 5388]
MALDGVFIYSLADELSNALAGTKIDKIYQPEKDEILIHIRKQKASIKLLLSASSSNPRAYITSEPPKENPGVPPTFCMLLRKNLTGGRIVEVTQPDFERILNITIEVYDELKNKKNMNLIIEIMGKHSNIILVDALENKIVDSIKRVPLSISSYRQVLPGNEYISPPPQDKLNPMEDISLPKFSEIIRSSSSPIFKAVYQSFKGISPLISREILYRASVDEVLPACALEDFELENIYNSFTRVFGQLKNNIFSPCISIDRATDSLIAFSCIRLTMYSSYSYIESPSPSFILEKYYTQRDIKERIKQKTINLRKNISNKLDRLYNKLQKQSEELLEAQSAPEFKLCGELITSYIYMIQKGMEEISLQNFYDEKGEEVTVKLNKNLTPSENAQKYFKKYNKLKNASLMLSEQMDMTKAEADYLENVLYSIENCESISEIEEIRSELIAEGIVKDREKKKKASKPSKPSASKESEPLTFFSSDGYEILVGKNNKQNDRLTLKIASPSDIWLHTKNIPGSHVIIKTNGGDASEQAVIEAATLAAYFSKAKMSSKVPVDYTERKNVKKPSGSKPGMVIYETNKTIYVTPSEEEFTKIKQNSPESK